MITVSVCMIVKNEETVLARCLECFEGIADEIIVVDTGSTDSTLRIARRFTDSVYSFSWHNDFAEARNFAFSKAKMDFIYSADADEIIAPQDQEKFRALKRNLPPDIELVQMQYANQLQCNTAYNFDRELRPKLYRRVRSFRWIEPIHETVDLQIRLLNSDIVVTHLPAQRHAPRDFSLFQDALENGPLDSRLHLFYAKELFIAGGDADFFTAYPYFESTLHDSARSLDDVRVSQCVVSRCARLRKNSTELFKTALKNVIGGAPSAEVCCELGAYFQAQNDFEEAATWYYTAAFGSRSEADIHRSGDIPLWQLAACYESLGLKPKAEKYRAQAAEWSPPKPE